MLDKHTQRTQSHLISQIKMRSQETPNFCLLIGAGASFSSGVKTAKAMMQEWAQFLYHQEPREESFDQWEKNQEWFDDEDKYSILFEKAYDQKPQRRNYIEQCVKNARPSWGYIYLSNIISKNFFNVVLTTNFDDLLNESSLLYTDFRPLVCAHDSTISDVRITSARPKIIKLHGDFLYDNIKNTVRETEALEKNMRDKFMQFAKEYGLIVIGYGGNDRSIMDILEMMVRSEENYFPHGVYWCIKDEQNVSKKVQKFLRRENTFWVKIDGFDDFMAELHNRLGLSLPKAINNPYEATTEWLNNFIVPKTPLNNQIIKKDIAQIQKQIENFEQRIISSSPDKDYDPLVPYEFIGNALYDNNEFNLAITYFTKELKKSENNTRVIEIIVFCYIALEKFDDALIQVERLLKLEPNNFEHFRKKALLLEFQTKYDDAEKLMTQLVNVDKLSLYEKEVYHNFLANLYLEKVQYEESLKHSNIALSINPLSDAGVLNQCSAQKKLNRNEKIEEKLRKVINRTKDRYFKACAYAILEDKGKMIKELIKSIKDDYKNRIYAKYDPDFSNYRDDKDFNNMLDSTVIANSNI